MIGLVATGLGALGVLSLSCQRPSNVTLNISGGSASGGSDTPVTTTCAESDFSALAFTNTQSIDDLLCTLTGGGPTGVEVSGVLVTAPTVPTTCTGYTYTFTCNTTTSTYDDGSETVTLSSFTITPESGIVSLEEVDITATGSTGGEVSQDDVTITLNCTAEAGNGTDTFDLQPLELVFTGSCPAP